MSRSLSTKILILLLSFSLASCISMGRPGSKGWHLTTPEGEITDYFSNLSQSDLCYMYRNELFDRNQTYIEQELSNRGKDRYLCYDETAERMRQLEKGMHNMRVQQMLNNNNKSSNRSYTDRQIDAMRRGTVTVPPY